MKGIALEYIFKFLLLLATVFVVASFLRNLFSFPLYEKEENTISEYIRANLTTLQLSSLIESCIEKVKKSKPENKIFFCFGVNGNFSGINEVLLYDLIDEMENKYNVLIDEKFKKTDNSLLILFNATANSFLILSI